MKDIIVAIDFSKGSIHALEYALELAGKLSSDVMLVWVDDQPAPVFPAISDAAGKRDEAAKMLDELIATYKKDFKGGKLLAKTRKGKVYQEIAAQAKINGCSLIVTGTHGVQGYEEYWVGSNANRIVTHAGCPVITVQNNYALENNRTNCIVVPLDHSPSTLHKIPFVVNFAVKTGAGICLLGINASPLKSIQRLINDAVIKAESYIKKNNVECMAEFIQTNDITTAIIEYTNKIDGGMIALVSQANDPSTHVILGQASQQLINYSPVPVLCLHPIDNFKI